MQIVNLLPEFMITTLSLKKFQQNIKPLKTNTGGEKKKVTWKILLSLVLVITNSPL